MGKPGDKQSYGQFIYTMRGQNNFVGEDSALFRQDLEYTMVTGKNLLVWKYPVKDALRAWPLETCQHLREQAVKKYNNVYDNANLLNSIYLTHSNQLKIDGEKMVQKQMESLYPLANSQAKVALKQNEMKQAHSNQNLWLATNTRKHVS